MSMQLLNDNFYFTTTESNNLFLSQNIHQLNTHCKYCFHLNCIPQMILCVYYSITQIKSKVTPACFSFFLSHPCDKVI